MGAEGVAQSKLLGSVHEGLVRKPQRQKSLETLEKNSAQLNKEGNEFLSVFKS